MNTAYAPLHVRRALGFGGGGMSGRCESVTIGSVEKRLTT